MAEERKSLAVRVGRAVRKFIEAVLLGWIFLGYLFLFLDWWVSTEAEFMSTEGEREFALMWILAIILYGGIQYLKHKVNEERRGYSQERGKVKRKA